MNTIADDYENLEHITRSAAELLSDRKIHASREEIIASLQELIDQGYAKAYLLSPKEPHSKPVVFSMAKVAELWFYLTPKGLRAVKNTDELRTSGPSLP